MLEELRGYADLRDPETGIEVRLSSRCCGSLADVTLRGSRSVQQSVSGSLTHLSRAPCGRDCSQRLFHSKASQTPKKIGTLVLTVSSSTSYIRRGIRSFTGVRSAKARDLLPRPFWRLRSFGALLTSSDPISSNGCPLISRLITTGKSHSYPRILTTFTQVNTKIFIPSSRRSYNVRSQCSNGACPTSRGPFFRRGSFNPPVRVAYGQWAFLIRILQAKRSTTRIRMDGSISSLLGLPMRREVIMEISRS